MPKNDATALPAGFSWEDFLLVLTQQCGTLSAVAQKLCEQRSFADDLETAERGLRRLRQRGHRDGGVWGRRLLLLFGLPQTAVDRARWMGQYHTRFVDLPTPLAHDLLVLWDRPPVSESPARIWIQLGFASLALRRMAMDTAQLHCKQAELVAPLAEPRAQIELLLVQAFIESKLDPDGVTPLLDRVERMLGQRDVPTNDNACLFARLVDQRAYALNRPAQGRADHARALELYQSIPDKDTPPFARCRRANGMGWSLLRMGRRQEAIEQAQLSVACAGDGGHLRLRGMALNLLSHALGGQQGQIIQQRALAIAKDLEDNVLLKRFARGADHG